MNKKRLLWIIPAVAVVIGAVAFLMSRTNAGQEAFLRKANLLKTEVVTDETVQALGDAPVDGVGHVVFLSLCDGGTRAKVYTGKGNTLSGAWDKAVQRAAREIRRESESPIWLRADVVSKAWPMTAMDMLNELKDTADGFDYHGLSFDPQFKTAFTEGEMNGRGFYDYKDNRVGLELVNDWLEENGKKKLSILPDDMMGFECWGWFCDENDVIYQLCREGADAGRRQLDGIDADYVKNIIDSASNYLVRQVREDGSFIYGLRPQYDKEIKDYNILRHSGTIWSLICRYRMFRDDALKEIIERAIDYMLEQLIYDGDRAYMCETDGSEIKLGGNGIAVVTMTEYMDVFETDIYRDVCVALGNGIIAQQGKDGSYWHILYPDLTRGESFRTVYYDGECTFALTRLYSLTGDQKWLDAACKAIDHFIAEDYTQYRDHWVAYSLNEATKYVDRQDYYDFALANATNNYKRIRGRSRTYPTNLELLVSAFETWQRMTEKGVDTGDFEVKDLLDVIAARINRQLSGYFYPEQAMYMQNPKRVLGSFMMRDDRFRVRIDDVQHNIGGFYLYWKNYDAMMAAGLDSGIMDETREKDG